jgi:hypothetical protein
MTYKDKDKDKDKDEDNEEHESLVKEQSVSKVRAPLQHSSVFSYSHSDLSLLSLPTRGQKILGQTSWVSITSSARQAVTDMHTQFFAHDDSHVPYEKVIN